MKIINKILLTIIICCGTYAYVSAQNSDCAASCADIMAGAPADCGANVAPAPGTPGSTAQPEFGGDGSGAGCQEWVDVTDFSPIPGEPPAPGLGSVFTLCSSWTATLPDAAFPSFEGVVTAQGATACFGGNMVAVFDAATCAPAGTLTQPGVGTAGQVTGLTIGTTYVVCTTYDYTTATDVNGAPCTPDAAQLTAEICTEVVEFGTPPLPACAAVPEPSPAYACSGDAFQVSVDMGGCTFDPTWDDDTLFGIPITSGYLAFYYVDAMGNFTNCPAGSTGDDVLTMQGDPANGVPGFIYFGETNLANGGGCSPVEIGAFTNPTCDPIDIPICLINGDVENAIVAIDEGADGTNDFFCDVYEITVTIYPNVETLVVADGGCDNSAYAFVTDGAGGFFDLDGDGALTPLDACDGAVLGGDPLDPAFDPANEADDCTDGATLDYDFTPAYVTGDANYPGCVEPAVGSLTCACADLMCVAVPEPSPAYACSGSAFQVSVDMGGCTFDPTWDDDTIFGIPITSGYLAFYYVDAMGNFTNCPPGSTGDDVLAMQGDPANGVPGFIYFGETNLANGGGCSPVEIAAFTNPTCEPIDIPICLLNGDVENAIVAIDEGADGTNDFFCNVYETTVTIYPNVEVFEAGNGSCDPIAGVGVTDGMGVPFDQDGDGMFTTADLCETIQLTPTADCTDGATLDYNFGDADPANGADLAFLTDANYTALSPACVATLTGTLTCTCDTPPSACVSDPIASPASTCQGAAFQVELDAACVTDPNFDVYPTDGTMGVSGWIAFNYVDAAGNFTTCPPGSTANDVLANINPPPGTAGFVFFGESNAANGGGCSPIDIGAFTNTTCAPIDVPICLVNGDVNTFVVAFDTDGDGVNDIACDVYETMVTIYPTLTTSVVDDGSTCGTPSVTLVDADGNVCETETAAAACAADGETFTTNFAGTATGGLMAAAPDAACALPAEVTVTCAGCGGMAMCSITPDPASNIVCDDNGTPEDPSDDTYTFDITVNGSNTDPAASGAFTDNLGNTGTYGSTISYGPYPISGGNVTINFTDNDDAGCTGMMMAAAPAPCSTPPACDISVAISNFACDDGGTPDDPSDDTVTFDYTVMGSTGGGWSSDQGDAAGTAYGTMISVGPVPATNASWTVNVTADGDPACTDSASITLSSCETVENIPTVGEWGLIILGLMMSITAIVGIRARREEEATA